MASPHTAHSPRPPAKARKVLALELALARALVTERTPALRLALEPVWALALVPVLALALVLQRALDWEPELVLEPVLALKLV